MSPKTQAAMPFDPDIEIELAEAITAHRLGAKTRTLRASAARLSQSARVLLERAEDCLQTIAQETQAAQAALVLAMEKAGISAAPEPLQDPQFQMFSVRIPPQQIHAALMTAASAGFVIPDGLGPAAARAMRYGHSHIDLMKRDAVTTRVSLVWRNPPPRLVRGAKRLLFPGLEDYGAVSLPIWLWPAYLLIKPIRVLRGLTGGRRREGPSHPYDPGVNLGTPQELIGPLLALARVDRDDVLIDIGCGDGRVVCGAALQTRCRAIGVEQNRLLARQAQQSVESLGLGDRVEVIAGTVDLKDLPSASVMFLFQPMHRLTAMLAELQTCVPAGTRVIAHEQSPLAEGLRPELTRTIFAGNAMTVAHLWTIGGS